LVAAGRDTLKQYALWLNEIMRREGEIEGAREDEAMKWQEALADKNAEIADKNAEIADKNAEIADKNAEIADKNAEIADKDAEIAALKARLEQRKGS
jgi:peptidoglycan hydrolase CwlO-like protein